MPEEARPIIPLGAEVTITKSCKPATVIAVAHFLRSQTQAQVEYVDGHGDLAVKWLDADQITVTPTEPLGGTA